MSTTTPSVRLPFRHGRTLANLRRRWRLFAANKGALFGLGVLVLVVVTVLLSDVMVPYDPVDITAGTALESPSQGHPFGTDQFGRDILSRVLAGTRSVVLTPLLAVAIGLCLGVPLGLLAGYAGGAVDSVTGRMTDVLLAFPSLLLALAVVAVLGPGTVNVQISVGVSLIPVFLRTTRGVVLSEKEKVYVDSARVVGCSRLRLLGRHILPNVSGPILVLATSATGWAIMIAASLNFLGLGVQPPEPDWGGDLANARAYIYSAWWMTAFPGFAITVIVLAVNLVGEGLQSALNPRRRG